VWETDDVRDAEATALRTALFLHLLQANSAPPRKYDIPVRPNALDMGDYLSSRSCEFDSGYPLILSFESIKGFAALLFTKRSL
jgi:hypothetical protein